MANYNTSEHVRNVVSLMREGAILGALASDAIHGYADDDITERKAFEKYGKAWVKFNTENGNLRFIRVGSTEKSSKLYSVFAIETLKRAQRHIEDEFNAAMASQKVYE